MRFAIPLSILSAALVAGATTASAVAADKDKKSAKACFQADDVRNWKFFNDNEQVNLTTSRNGVFTGEVSGVCPSADFSLTLGIKSRFSRFICEGEDATLYVRGGPGGDRCRMQRIRKLTPAEVASLPKEQKP
jgi:hypothetical protein